MFEWTANTEPECPLEWCLESMSDGGVGTIHPVRLWFAPGPPPVLP